MKDPKCIPGCKNFYGGEIEHHKDCPYYPESFTKRMHDEIDRLQQVNEAFTNHNISLKEEVVTLRDKINGLEARGAKLQYEKDTLQNVYNALAEVSRGKSKAIATLTLEIKKLEAENESLRLQKY